MHAYTWGLSYNRQIGPNPMAWNAEVEGGHYHNGDNGSYEDLRATLGLTLWLGGGSAAEASRRSIFDTHDFARVIESGNNID
jgi:hypothetical protein